MGDRAWARIQIGGHLPKSKLPDFERFLKSRGFYSEKQTYKDILAGDPGILEYEDVEVNYTNFGVEDELQKLGLTYLKENAAGDEYEAGKEYWEPGMETPKTSVDTEGEESIAVSTLLEMIENVERVSKRLDELPLHINDDDDQMKHIVNFYSSTPKRRATPLECLKTYVQKYVVPTFIPPFVVED